MANLTSYAPWGRNYFLPNAPLQRFSIMKIWKENCGYLSVISHFKRLPQCLSTSHIPAQGCGEENQHLSYSHSPRISELFPIISSQTNEENGNALPNTTALHAQYQP